jgi:uncharacterized membrane protein
MNKISTGFRFHWKKLIQYFLQGLLVIAPLAITMYLFYWFITSIDSLVPIFTVEDEKGNLINRNYGLGFLIIVVSLIVIGFLSSNFITGRVFSLFDEWLERAPGVKFVYSSIRDFFEAFAGNKRKFNKPVLVALRDEAIFQIGFITDEDASEFGLTDYVTVYVPFSYSFAGQAYLVPKSRVKQVDHVSSADAMKYVISGGLTTVEDEHPSTDIKN